MKKCITCSVIKKLNEFSFKNKKENKRNRKCKECHRKYTKLHYAKNKESYKKRTKINGIKYRKELEDFIICYLKAHPCVDCGEENPVVLEFDHIKDKKFSIATGMSRKKSINSIKNEINKCEVRCANCHRIKTAKQFGWFTIL